MTARTPTLAGHAIFARAAAVPGGLDLQLVRTGATVSLTALLDGSRPVVMAGGVFADLQVQAEPIFPSVSIGRRFTLELTAAAAIELERWVKEQIA